MFYITIGTFSKGLNLKGDDSFGDFSDLSYKVSMHTLQLSLGLLKSQSGISKQPEFSVREL